MEHSISTGPSNFAPSNGQFVASGIMQEFSSGHHAVPGDPELQISSASAGMHDAFRTPSLQSGGGGTSQFWQTTPSQSADKKNSPSRSVA